MNHAEITGQDHPINFRSLCVLVIEDDRPQRMLLTHMLKKLGVTLIYEAADGIEGLQQVKQIKPDVAICDILMEPGNGYEFLRTIRQLPEASLRKIPVVMASGVESPGSVMKSRCLEADAYMRKPFRATAIEAALQNAMSYRRVGTAMLRNRPKPVAPACVF